MKIIVTTQSLKFSEDKKDFDVSSLKTYGRNSDRYDLDINYMIEEEDIRKFLDSDQEIMVIELYKSKV